MKKHTIDIVFSLSLFMVFVVCSFLLVLFQINGYHDLQYDADNLYTASSFIQGEVRQSDTADAIEIATIQGVDCLVIHHREGVSYLYQKDGMLMELYQDAALDVNFAIGEKRFALDTWQLSLTDGLLQVILYKADEQVDVRLHIKSGGNEYA